MKRLVSVFIITAVITGCFCSCRKMQPQVFVPDKEINQDEYVRFASGVGMEMTVASYWQKETYNKQLMSDEQIKTFNSNNNKLITRADGSHISLTEYNETIDGKDVRFLINSLAIKEDEKKVFVNRKTVGKDYWDKLKQNENIGAVPEKINVKFAFSTERTSLRKYPTRDYANNEDNDLFYDDFIMSDYMPFSPLVILHESKDSKWYFVSMYGYSGWIEKKYTAICDSKQDWLSRINVEEFLIVTGKELRLQDDPYCPQLSLQLLPMGTKIPLVKTADAPQIIHQRSTYGNYVVKLPVRTSEGKIKDEFFLIPYTEDVHIGYLSYTSNNVLEQAFKLQGDIYGWAGDFHSNDCSGIIREIFLCFGIELPRTGNQQMNVNGLRFQNLSGKSDYDKLEIIKNLIPGSFIYIPGHIMIYLGIDNNEPFVISSAGSISDTTVKEGKIIPVNSVFVSGLIKTTRKTGATWLESVEKVLEVLPEEK